MDSFETIADDTSSLCSSSMSATQTSENRSQTIAYPTIAYVCPASLPFDLHAVIIPAHTSTEYL